MKKKEQIIETGTDMDLYAPLFEDIKDREIIETIMNNDDLEHSVKLLLNIKEDD